MSICVLAEARTFTSVHAQNAEDFREPVQIMQSIVSTAEVTFDESQRSVSVRGSDEDAAAEAWLFERLDGNALSGRPVGVNNTIEVLKVEHAGYGTGLLELATAIRSAGEIRSLWVQGARKMIVLRGTPA